MQQLQQGTAATIKLNMSISLATTFCRNWTTKQELPLGGTGPKGGKEKTQKKFVNLKISTPTEPYSRTQDIYYFSSLISCKIYIIDELMIPGL